MVEDFNFEYMASKKIGDAASDFALLLNLMTDNVQIQADVISLRR